MIKRMIGTYSLSALLVGGALWIASSAQASVVASGDGVSIAAPSSVMTGALTSDSNFYVFEEKTTTLGAPLAVDWFASNGGNLTNGGGGTIAAGTPLTSYFVHFEPASTTSEVSGNLTFSQKIIAVIFNWDNLGASDSVLGATGTTYPTGQTGRKYESFDQENSYLVNDYTLHINTKSWFNPKEHLMDQARVITAPVPVPAALWLFGSGILALLGISRRRKAAAAATA